MAANFEIVKDTLKKYKGKGIANIEITEGVKVIGQDVFWGCKEIQRIKIPEGVTKIGYATEATVLLDQNSLQAAMDEAMANAKDGNIGLYYQNDATSSDGTNFDCFIGNSNSNIYDMFLTIYADAELTDQIFLSGLVPPGSGFESITLDHALDPGVHTVYVALTQVDTDEETGEQVLKNQVMHTMDFHVYG